MAFLPYNVTTKARPQTAPGDWRQQPAADDWHMQWGGSPEASGPGGGEVPFQAGAQPPPMPDWSQYRGQNQLGSPPGVDWNRGSGPKMGGSAPGPYADNPNDPMSWQRVGPQAGGGFVPLSQLGRGGATIFGGGPPMTQPGVPATGSPGGGMVLLRAPNGQTRQVPGDQVAHYLARGATRG